jgi:endonuclease/exonuclease/phosphatase family metal-dependent hydrolase
VEKAARLPKNVPFVLTGDFNSPAGGEVFQLFERDMKDAWSAAPFRFGPEGTFNSFGAARNATRIDWIFLRGGVKPLQVHTSTLSMEGRYPSDHYPVFAVLRFE